MYSMELKQFYFNRSNEWIQDVLSHLLKSENEDLVRQTLEAHVASQPSRTEVEKQAYGWIQWAKHRKHLKVFVLRFANTRTLYVFVIFTVRNSSCGKVMFSQVSVCPQGGGVHPPWAETPPDRRSYAETPPPPRADTPPHRQTATAADGTHSTGMHSCWLEKLMNQKSTTFDSSAIPLHRLLHVTYHQEYCRKM